MSIYVSPARSATALRNFHVTSMGNVEQAACKTVSHARDTIARAAWCMDMHELLDVALAYGFEGPMRSAMVSYLTESILANSSDPVIRNLVDDTPAADYSAAEEQVENVEDYDGPEYTESEVAESDDFDADSECAFAAPHKPTLLLDVLKERNGSDKPDAPIPEKKVKFAEQSADELPTLVRTVSKIDAFQTPTKPAQPKLVEEVLIAPPAPKKAAAIKQLDAHAKPIVPQKKLDWADITDEDDQLAAAEAKINTAIAEAAKQKRDKLTWALRIKLATVPDKDLDAAIEAERVASELASKQMAELAAKQAAELEAKQAAELEAKKAADAKYKKFRSMTPAKPAKKISNDDVKAMLAEQKTEQEDADAGFIKVGGKRRSAAPLKPQKFTSSNKHPEKQKSTTSAKWFFFPDKPIMSEADDWNLWDYNTDDYGLTVPIGWYRLAANKFKINRKSSFIHTRHEDGSWSHEEEIQLDDDTGSKQTKRVPVSVDYLRWILTPPPMRRGACPDE